jgi:hypothetical protein
LNIPACGYGFIAVSKEEYRFRKLLVAFLFTTVTLNLLVTALMGTPFSRMRSFRALNEFY